MSPTFRVPVGHFTYVHVERREGALGVGHLERALRARGGARVANLATLFAVEGSLAADHRHALASVRAGDFLAVRHQGDNFALGLRGFVAKELGRAHAAQDGLKDRLDGDLARAREVGPLALFVHGAFEADLVHVQPVASTDDPR